MPARSVAPAPVARAGASSVVAPSAAAAPVVASYDVTYDARAGTLGVVASIEAGSGGSFAIDGAEAWVRDLVALDPRDGQRPIGRAERRGGRFEVPACARSACRLRYTFALREAARAKDELDVASAEGDVLEAPPSTWLLVPEGRSRASRVRLRVKVPDGARFVTGLFASPEANDAWDVSLDDLVRAPYSAFGPLRTRRLEVGAGDAPASIELALAPGKLVVDDAELASWTTASARAVAGYFGRFPLPTSLVLVVPGTGPWVGVGRTLAGGGGTIFMRVGDAATTRHLGDDWVMVHEMIHLAFPSVAREHDWAEEGLATYVEPIARARAGLTTPEAAWAGLAHGLPNGLPRAGDRGLDHTPTWGRTYWGGALFWLLADVGIRKATANARGLEHALRGLVARGVTNATRRHLDDALAIADDAAHVDVLVKLHAAMAATPHPVDLDALFASLGVVREGRGIRFDDTAKDAAIRRAITPP